MFSEFIWKTIHLATLFITPLTSRILHDSVIKSSNPLRALGHYGNSCSPPHWHLNGIRGCICPLPSSSLAGPNSSAKTLGCRAPWTLNERPGSALGGAPRFSERSSSFPPLPHTERQNKRGALRRVITGWVTGYLRLALHFNHSPIRSLPATEIDFKMGQWNITINTEGVKWLSVMINAYKWSVIQRHTLDRLFIVFRGLKEFKFVYMATRLAAERDFIITH